MRVGVVGAGRIGSWAAAMLSAAGVPVVLVGRTVPARPVAVTLQGRFHAAAGDLVPTDDPSFLGDVDAVLVCVRSQDTAEALRSIAASIKPETELVSLQNGLRNVPALRALWPHVVPGMVTFNVRAEGEGRFRQTTSGPLLIGPGRHSKAIAQAFAKAGVEAGVEADVEGVQAAKLLLNLNNGLCAATGLSIADSLRSRDLRWCLSTCIREGLDVFERAGVRPRRIGALAPGLVAQVLRTPDAIFSRVARRMLAVDPTARSSTLQDLEAGKGTEIDFLNGEIDRIARACGAKAPANAFVTAEVKRLEASPDRIFLAPAALRAGLERVRA